MGWKKRPSNIKAIKESRRVPYHIGIVAKAVEARAKALKDLGMEMPTRITFNDI